MAPEAATQALAEQPVKAPAVKNPPDRSRLTQAEVAILFQLREEGFTQSQIAQRLGCNQPTVSKWLATLTDTTSVAKEYLRGSALKMAKNIVAKGQPRDHVAALKGLSVLQDDSAARVQIGVMVGLPGMPEGLSPLQVVAVERKGEESLAIEAGSDKPPYVNE